MALDDKGGGLDQLQYGLMELRLRRVLSFDQGDYFTGMVPHTFLRSPKASSAGHGCAKGGSRSIINPDHVARP
jgi:hypothetical protein